MGTRRREVRWPPGREHPGQGGVSHCMAGPDRWRVRQYRSNRSAFNGYRVTRSDYSEVVCLDCRTRWRTRAPYVDWLQGEEKENG